MNETRHRVLDALSDGPVSGPALAEDLGISRSAVWKHVEALREAGFTIASDDAGYSLAEVPEFGGLAVEYGLDAPFDIEYHDSIPSTNARARDLAAEGASDVVVLANEQTGGRGRLDRDWVSPSGGIWLSILFRPDVPMAHAPVYTLAAAVAATRAAREAGVEATIKWPNDVLVSVTSAGTSSAGDDDVLVGGEERKLVGILTEMEGEADRVSWVVVGIGVNANVDPDSLPSEANPTSLQAVRGEAVDRRLFTQRLVETFDTLRQTPESVLDEWREYATTLGKRVRVETPKGVVEGEAVDVEFPGRLVVETDDGRQTVSAGDCEHLRPV
ncbi:biotin--[acetyl-CoA-carboxylase] ligase [Haloarcula sp. JP-L23]|uniref:biotin--[acetyl-CoA-carboxylase] ligase n=1 Tax=Haloarcula sp. JP-L23 TaxID=2716717 RepID=UPI00140F46E1|nr:biotin--[acetyl-CoA-carboxylase] ligase [Haloarcula sp. JP-L23]